LLYLIVLINTGIKMSQDDKGRGRGRGRKDVKRCYLKTKKKPANVLAGFFGLN